MNRRVDDLGLAGRVVALTAVLALLAGGSFAGQSLGSVAKEAEAKRKSTKSSGKVYTNDSIKSDPRDVPTPAPASASAPATAEAPPADEKAKQVESDKVV